MTECFKGETLSPPRHAVAAAPRCRHCRRCHRAEPPCVYAEPPRCTVAPPPCGGRRGALVSAAVLRPLSCAVAAVMSQPQHRVSVPPTARRKGSSDEVIDLGSHSCSNLCFWAHIMAPAAPPLRHEHGLQLSEHPCALRASLLGSPFQILRGIRNYI